VSRVQDKQPLYEV